MRHCVIARRTDCCCTLSHGCCSREVSPCAWRILATSTAGRLMAGPSASASGATAGGPRARDLQLLQWIGRRLEVALRQMQVHGRVGQVRVAEEDLDRPQVCAGLQEMRRGPVPQRVGTHATIDAGGLGGEAHRVPDALGGQRLVGAPAVFLSWKEYVFGRIHRQYCVAPLAASGLRAPRARGHLSRRSTRITMRWLSMSATFSCSSSLRRRPAP